MISQVLQEKINRSYDILKLGLEISRRFYQKPLICCFSGGKDSSVLTQLAMECLKPEDIEVFCSWTTCDAPQTCRFIKSEFKRFEDMGIKTTIHYPTYQGKPVSMWTLISLKRLPPTRLMRYCCTVLKETTTPNRFVATGVRAEESTSRSHSYIYIYRERDKKKRGRGKSAFSYEHTREVFDEAMAIDGQPYAEAMDCVLIEKARKQEDLVCNPIFEWSLTDVWEFIRDRGIPYNPLYDPPYNYERVGCIGCPLGGRKNQLREFNDFPQYKKLYISAFQRMIDKRKADGMETAWNTGEECFDWWVGNDPNQLSLSDIYNEDGTLKENP